MLYLITFGINFEISGVLRYCREILLGAQGSDSLHLYEFNYFLLTKTKGIRLEN